MTAPPATDPEPAGAAGERPGRMPRFGTLGDSRPFAIASLLAIVALVGVRLSMTRSRFEDGGQWWLGVAAGVLFALPLLLSLRRRARALLPGSLRGWYLVHVWAGVASGVAVWLHAGAGAAHGLHPLLRWTALGACISGVVLAIWQRAALRALTRRGDSAGLLDDLLADRARLRGELVDLGAPGVAEAPGSEGPVRERLAAVRDELRRIEARIEFHGRRARLVALHVVVSAIAAALVAVHVVAVLRY